MHNAQVNPHVSPCTPFMSPTPTLSEEEIGFWVWGADFRTLARSLVAQTDGTIITTEYETGARAEEFFAIDKTPKSEYTWQVIRSGRKDEEGIWIHFLPINTQEATNNTPHTAHSRLKCHTLTPFLPLTSTKFSCLFEPLLCMASGSSASTFSCEEEEDNICRVLLAGSWEKLYQYSSTKGNELEFIIMIPTQKILISWSTCWIDWKQWNDIILTSKTGKKDGLFLLSLLSTLSPPDEYSWDESILFGTLFSRLSSFLIFGTATLSLCDIVVEYCREKGSPSRRSQRVSNDSHSCSNNSHLIINPSDWLLHGNNRFACIRSAFCLDWRH